MSELLDGHSTDRLGQHEILVGHRVDALNGTAEQTPQQAWVTRSPVVEQGGDEWRHREGKGFVQVEREFSGEINASPTLA
ncbi:MAG: hypothetical protein OXG44_06995 [Gammaproteobacteria bacterium]|nr:hypothetical protein [Gammaproteobacteria bacterium]